ncbi:hypothetical protein [Pontibacter sp. G13]|uniref:hypothetical protein n=1 Tax=Pontibacter sp. G13 TaxID=3074898 RepID=UPI00288BEFEA|nr:hypothetical protein [Pontibacter sp. G13]WNJ21609.1 hypothetical protein RJD25_28830 [Pontibacter sp. G13]
MLQAWALLLGVPFILLTGLGGNLFWMAVGLAGFGFFRGIYDTNIFAAVFDVIDRQYQATLSGLMGFAAFILGGTAPWVLGILKEHIGLRNGIAWLAAGYLMAGLVIAIWGIPAVKRELGQRSRAGQRC